jgi:hypothetical protein
MISPPRPFLAGCAFLIHDVASTEVQDLIAALGPQFHRL